MSIIGNCLFFVVGYFYIDINSSFLVECICVNIIFVILR